MKNENAKKIIAIVVVLLVLAVVAVLVASMTGGTGLDGSSGKGGLLDGLTSSSNKTEYINEGATSDNKLAALFIEESYMDKQKKGMVVTIDDENIVSTFNNQIILEDTDGRYTSYFGANDLNGLKVNKTNPEIGGWFNPNKDIAYTIGISDFYQGESVIYEEGDWYIVRSFYKGESFYRVFYKFDLGNDEHFSISNTNVKSDEEAKELLKECKKRVNFYYLDETSDNYLTVLDKNNNKVDLSEYTFANDLYAKVLQKDGLVVKSSIYIRSGIEEYVIIRIPIENGEKAYKQYVINLNSEKTEAEPNSKIEFNFKNVKVETQKEWNTLFR